MRKLLVTEFKGAKPFGINLTTYWYNNGEYDITDVELIKTFITQKEVVKILHNLFGEFYANGVVVNEYLEQKALECYVMLTDFNPLIKWNRYNPTLPNDSLKGLIVIPVNNSDIERINRSKGHSTVLDGGYLWIDSLVDEDEFVIDGLTQIKEFSS